MVRVIFKLAPEEEVLFPGCLEKDSVPSFPSVESTEADQSSLVHAGSVTASPGQEPQRWQAPLPFLPTCLTTEWTVGQ